MLYLRTLGAVFVAGEDRIPLGGAASQRRLLAILAVLSVADEGGMGRDRIQFLLWPEGDPDRARHSLTQALYHARRSLDCDDLFLAGADLRLNPERISSDIQQLKRALAESDLRRAAELYSGPLMDGFFVPGAGALEQWVDSQRQQLSERMRSTFDELARERLAASDFSAAVEWRRRQAATDPLGGTTAIQLVEAMTLAGDRPGALRHASLYETLLWSELEVRPDPRFQALVSRLRDASVEPARPTPSDSQPVWPEIGVPVAEGPPVAVQPAAGRPRRLPMTKAIWLTGVALGVIALGLLTWSMSDRPSATDDAPLDQAIVVAPFRVTGLDRSLSFLREGVVELLSTRVGDDSAARAVDPGVVLRAWRANRLLETGDPPREEVISLAHRFGALNVLTGSIVGDVRHLVINTTLLAVPDGRVVATASAEGPLDSLTALLDLVAGKLLMVKAGEGERLADRVTPSLRALRAYLDGQASYRAGRYALAAVSYERAVRADSTFALAALQLALAADRVNSMHQHHRALAIAWENRHELHPRDRALLVAFAGPRYPAPSSEAEQLAAWNAAVTLAPDRADVWTELGERFFYGGRVLGIADNWARAAAALRRALALDPSDVVARRLMVLVAAKRGDSIALRAIATPSALRDSMGTLGSFIEWRASLAMDQPAALMRIRQRLSHLDDANLRAIAMASQFDAVAGDDGQRAVGLRAARVKRTADRLDAVLAQHSLALNQGRPHAALQLTGQLEDLQPGSRAHLRLRVLDALYGGGDTVAARLAIESLMPAVASSSTLPPIVGAFQLADLCVIGQWQLAHGRSDDVVAIVGRLRDAGLPRAIVPVGANPHTCAELLDVALAVLTADSNALQRVARLDSLMLGGPAAGDAAAYVHIAVARLYERIGEPALALAAIGRRPYMTGWPRYLATARREQGRLASLTGDRNGALTMYRSYLALRSGPESAVRAEVDSVRAALSVLGGL